MPLSGNLVGAANQPGVFRGAILAKLGEELFQAGIELPLGAVSIEAQGRLPADGIDKYQRTDMQEARKRVADKFREGTAHRHALTGAHKRKGIQMDALQNIRFRLRSYDGWVG